MNAKTVIAAVMFSCGCSEQDAKDYIKAELRNLRELAAVNDLRYDDIECACSNLGIESDYEEWFIGKLAYCV